VRARLCRTVRSHTALDPDIRFRTCIEYEGLHHLTPEQQALDACRDQRVTDAGWRQVKVNSIDMSHGREWVVSRVRQALRMQGWPG
jgi:very-short-patch-repair endonuclease